MLGTMVDRWQERCFAWAMVIALACCSVATAQQERRRMRAGGPPPTTRPSEADAQAGDPAKMAEKADGQAKAVTQEEDPPRPEGIAVSFEPIIALVGAQVRTLDSTGTLESGVVLIQSGKITAVGDSTTAIPARAKRIDLSGLVLTPGLIDADSKLWLASDSLGASSSDASLDIVDGLDPYADDWFEVVRHGVTTVYVQPASSGVMSGYGAVVGVAPRAGEPVIHQHLASLQASFGSSASSNRVRSQQYERIKKQLENAAEYAKKWKEYNDYQAKMSAKKEGADKLDSEGKSSAEKGSSQPEADKPADGKPAGTAGDKSERQPGSEPAQAPEEQKTAAAAADAAKGKEGNATTEKKEEPKPPKKPDLDPVLEKLVKVLEGEIAIRFEVGTADEAAYLQRLLDDEKFAKVQVILSGLTDLRSSMETIVASNRPVVLGAWLDLERSDGRRESPVQAGWGKAFADYSGSVAIVSGGRSKRSSRLLRASAARAIAYGFAPEQALRSVTVEAARILGVEDRLGTITVGKQADLVAFHGEPLDPSSPVKMVVIGGEIVFENEGVETTSDASLATSANRTDKALPTRLPGGYRLRGKQVLVGGKLQPALLTIRDGKIVDVQTNDTDGNDTDLREIDCGDAVITPGLFSAHSQLGVTRYVDPRGLPDASLVVAADGWVNEPEGLQSLVSGGLLRAAIAPGDANPVAGCISVVRLAAENPIVQREGALKLVLTSAARSSDAFPSSLGGQVQLLEQSLAGKLLDSRLYVPAALDTALNARRSAAFQASMGQDARLTVLAASTDAEIRAALDVIERHQLNGALLGPRQLLPFIDRLQALKVGVIVQGSEPETFQWFYDDLAAAVKAGIPVAFAGENAEQLRLTAALSGLPFGAALNALCTAPKAWGLKAGSLAPNEPADLVIWSDNPLDLSAVPLRVIVDGRMVAEGM